jgi:hypothetical protein
MYNTEENFVILYNNNNNNNNYAGVFPTTGNIWEEKPLLTRVKPINMERQTLRSLGKQPLPWERQDTSRAGARRDSGSRLTRRITAQKNPTAYTIMDNQQQRVLNTAESVLMEGQLTTTKTGTVRKLIMLSNQMNKNIIRCYMKCTKEETKLTAYRQNMYTQFVELYPEIAERLSEQNVADRRRATITQQMLTEIEINEIKNQVKQELQEQTIQVDLAKPTEHEEINQIKNHQETRNQLTPQNESIINTNEDLLTKLKEKLDTVITEFTGTDPLSRHKIPKPKVGPKLMHILESVIKDILPKYLKECHKLKDIHFITYCSALATI